MKFTFIHASVLAAVFISANLNASSAASSELSEVVSEDGERATQIATTTDYSHLIVDPSLDLMQKTSAMMKLIGNQENLASVVLNKNGYSDEEGNLFPTAFAGLDSIAINGFYNMICWNLFYIEGKYEQVITASRVAGYLDAFGNLGKTLSDFVAVPSGRYTTLKVLMKTCEQLAAKDKSKIGLHFSILQEFFCDEKGVIYKDKGAMKAGNVYGISAEQQLSEKAFIAQSILSVILAALALDGGTAAVNWTDAAAQGKELQSIINPLHSVGFCDEVGNVNLELVDKLSPIEKADLISTAVGLVFGTAPQIAINLLQSTGYLTEDGKENSELIDALPYSKAVAMRSVITSVFRMQEEKEASAMKTEAELGEENKESLKEIFTGDDSNWNEKGRRAMFISSTPEEQAYLLEVLPAKKYVTYFLVLNPAIQAMLYYVYFSQEQQRELDKYLSEEDKKLLETIQAEVMSGQFR